MSPLRELVFLVYLVLEDEFAPAMHPTTRWNAEP
jgi:hypothetical protein